MARPAAEREVGPFFGPVEVEDWFVADLDPGSGGGGADPGGGGDAVPPRPSDGGGPEGGAPSPEEPGEEGGAPVPVEPPQEGGPPLPEVPTTYEDVRIEVWLTADDARVCPVCGPLHGTEYEAGEGPYPPAHMGCRCRRVLARIDRRARRGRWAIEDVWEIERPEGRGPGESNPGGATRRF